MEFHQVRYFLALARTLNFTRAAELCNVSQPALTKAIQKLEYELGGPLIYRERQLTQLTDLGKIVLPMLEQTVAAAEAVWNQAQDYRRCEIAPFKIGLTPSISAAIVVAPLSEVVQRVPGLRLELVEAPTERLVEMLLEGSVSAALVTDPQILPDRIDHWRLFDERYLVVASRSHPLASLSAIPVEALTGAVWLERAGSEAASPIRALCRLAQGAEPKISHRACHDSQLQYMVEAGLGIILAPEHAPRLPALAAIPLEGDPLRQEIQLLVVAGRRYSPALDAFIKSARLRDWTPQP